MTINKIRSLLYLTARLLGDAKAVSQGPEATGRRIIRRMAGKVTSRILRGLFK